MKLKKLSGFLSAVLAGAMVLSMAPAAFAAATDGAHTEYEPIDSTHHKVVHYEANGTSVVWDNNVPCTFEYNAQGTHVGTESGTFCICRNQKAAEPVEKPGTTYIPVDTTHHRVHTVDQNGKVTYDEVAACVFETGTCTCGNTCKHVGVQKVVDNGNGTHNVVCPTCKEVLGTAEHSYDKDGKCACGAVKPEEPGTTYIPVDTTHHRVHTVDQNGKVTYDEVAACVFETGTCICGNTCNHVGVQKVVDNGDGTHNVVCPTCGEILDKAEHSYDKDGKCACGAEKPVTVCDHVNQYAVDNHNGTCSYVCKDCNAVIDTQAHVYYDGETKCARCGAEEPACDHMGQHFKFVANNNGTHNVLCADCGAVVSENVPCTYVDGKCQQCGAAQPAPVPTPDPVPTPGSSVSPVATALGLGTWLLVLGGLILGFFGL